MAESFVVIRGPGIMEEKHPCTEHIYVRGEVGQPEVKARQFGVAGKVLMHTICLYPVCSKTDLTGTAISWNCEINPDLYGHHHAQKIAS